MARPHGDITDNKTWFLCHCCSHHYVIRSFSIQRSSSAPSKQKWRLLGVGGGEVLWLLQRRIFLLSRRFRCIKIRLQTFCLLWCWCPATVLASCDTVTPLTWIFCGELNLFLGVTSIISKQMFPAGTSVPTSGAPQRNAAAQSASCVVLVLGHPRQRNKGFVGPTWMFKTPCSKLIPFLKCFFFSVSITKFFHYLPLKWSLEDLFAPSGWCAQNDSARFMQSVDKFSSPNFLSALMRAFLRTFFRGEEKSGYKENSISDSSPKIRLHSGAKLIYSLV